ncbi:Glycosyltransferase involved in cell wall bisynthesis [Chishuiella changwenlii]|uniref:Glycosyl transferase n=1 Tax=Chishuiella changwenlii TaxID=1434701 RepID=A0A1M6XZ16_9FLAO|nr:glycosyltransferase [Chishuiella changwenlii]GGE94022.1 glycosyl transferase [Chishuiella changwenlii]SHL11241.1 Glycosyltransferase involved in cell wall bisynthesis [Chishuiella changwenlii]
MKILNVTSIVEWRGGDAQMYTIYNLLNKYKDIKQYILCPENSLLAEKCKHDNADYFTYKKKSKIKSLVSPIIRIVEEQNIDVLHIHDSSALSAAILAKMFTQIQVKIIYSRKRNNRIKDNFFSKLKYDNSYVEKIICVSKAVEKIYLDIKMNQSKLLVIYDAIDVSKFTGNKSKNIIHKELNISDDTLIIGNICSLSKQKDINTFVDTAKLVLEKIQNKVEFVLIGGGELEKELKDYVDSLNLGNKIHFLGFRNNVNELLPELNVLLITSLTEGLPLSVYEAFASKVPIVSTKAGGISEVIIDNETGFLAEVGASNALSSKILTLLDNDELRKEIVEKAFNLVSSNFDLKNLEENYYKFYKSLEIKSQLDF